MRNVFNRDEQGFRAKLMHALYRAARFDLSDRPGQASINVRATGRSAFTLVEVIIVAVVLTVLLATVWSLFAMQQRTLERGQRLSRDTRVSLALQRLLHDDLSRTAVRLASPAIESNANRSISSVATPSSEGLGRSFSDDESDLSVPVQFLFAGGSDWLIVDVLRPAYQMGAFETSSTDENPLASQGSSSSSLSAVANLADNNPEELPQREPTPFERVIYLWLTEDEIQEVTGLLYGHEQRPQGTTGADSLPSQSAGTNNSSATTDRQDDMGLTDVQTMLPGSQRTLLRIRTDWSWPRESEMAGTTWDDVTGPEEDGGLDFASGLDRFSGSTSPQRRQWLRRLLWQSRSAYREFHLQAESAINLNDTTNRDNQTSGLGGSGDPADMSESGQDQFSRHLLPNQWEPQVDWFPEVVAGKFQFFDGKTWQDSFSERPAVKLPLAVRLQYEVDARRYPVQVDLAAVAAGSDNSQELLSLDPRTTQLGSAIDDPLLGDLLSTRPEFPRVAVFTFHSQASRRDTTLELDSEADLENDGESDDPFSDFENPANQDQGSDRGRF